MAKGILRAVFALPDNRPLCAALAVIVCQDLTDAAMHPDEPVGWSPLTIQVARRLRELNQEHGLYDEEPALIRGVLDGSWL
jgi:hypothetical protein